MMVKVKFGQVIVLLGVICASMALLGSDESDTPTLFRDLARAREAREGRVAPVPAVRADSPIPDDASFADFDDYQYESGS